MPLNGRLKLDSIAIQNPTTDNAYFDAPSVPYGQEIILQFTYTLTNLTGGIQDYILSKI